MSNPKSDEQYWASYADVVVGVDDRRLLDVMKDLDLAFGSARLPPSHERPVTVPMPYFSVPSQRSRRSALTRFRRVPAIAAAVLLLCTVGISASAPGMFNLGRSVDRPTQNAYVPPLGGERLPRRLLQPIPFERQ